MEFVMYLRTYFQKKYPDDYVSGSIYYGYMDMSYFSFVPQSLKERKLKIAIVFLHEAFRFEVWLAALNKQVQIEYWNLFKDSDWDKYQVVPSTKGFDSILEYILVDNPDFRDLDALTSQIEEETLKFTQDIERFLSTYETEKSTSIN